MKNFQGIKILMNTISSIKNEKIKEEDERITFKLLEKDDKKLTATIKQLSSYFSNISISISAKKELIIERKDKNLPVWDKIVKSAPSKTGEVRTFGLQARDTCPRWKKSEVCKHCYAVKGNYSFQNTMGRRKRNLLIMKQDNFVEEMRLLLFNDRFFRWFDSGDFASILVIIKIIQVCKATPWVKHWIPTNAYDVPEFLPYIKELESLKNVTLRYSSRKYNQAIDWNISSMVRTKESTKKSTKKMFICPSSKQGGKCLTCRACWDKKVKVIIYKKH